MSGYANYGTGLFAVLMLVGWWMARPQSGTGAMVSAVWAPIGVLAALAINQPIADAVDERRPCNGLHDIVVLHCSADAGFPSDHAVMAGAATVGLFLVNRRLGMLAAVASVAMGIARVYIGAHYPQDVVAGLALGALVSLSGHAVTRRPLSKLIAIISRGPLGIFVTTSS